MTRKEFLFTVFGVAAFAKVFKREKPRNWKIERRGYYVEYYCNGKRVAEKDLPFTAHSNWNTGKIEYRMKDL